MSDDDLKKALAEIFTRVLSSQLSEEDIRDGQIMKSHMEKIIEETELNVDVRESKESCAMRFAFETGDADLGRTENIKIVFETNFAKRRTSVFAMIAPEIPATNQNYDKVRDVIMDINNSLFSGTFMVIDDDSEGVLMIGFRNGLNYAKAKPPEHDLVRTFFLLSIATLKGHLKELWKIIEQKIPEEELIKKGEKKKDYGLKDMQPSGVA